MERQPSGLKHLPVVRLISAERLRVGCKVWWALFALLAGFSDVRLEGAQYQAGNLVIAMENAVLVFVIVGCSKLPINIPLE